MKNEFNRLISYYQMLSLLYVSIGCIALSTILFSCSSPSVKNPLLLRADSLMETRPDSALTILESISSPEKLSGAERAFYALLFTQAQHKNFIPLEDDSLIKTAVDYYGDKKKSLNAAKAHYYLGATYWDKGSVSFAVEEYLNAIRLMPERNDFLAMIYNTLGECYEDDDLYKVAMDAYHKANQILSGKNNQSYSLRGIARVFLLQNNVDSALCYYQQALNCAIENHNSHLTGTVYHDIALIHYQEKDFNKANEYVSKSLCLVNREMLATVKLLKAEIMINMNELDSAEYYFNGNIEQLDIFGKATYYNGLHKIAKKRCEWKTATENMDKYIMLYDSVQILSNNNELIKLMDKHQLEEHKRMLSEKAKRVVIATLISFSTLIIGVAFGFMLIDRRRKKRIIDLQQELNQIRVDATLLRDEASETDNGDITQRKIELIEQQIHVCKLIFRSTHPYEVLETMKKATPKQLLDMDYLREEVKDGVLKSFVDVMNSLNEDEIKLTPKDRYFCVLILLNCSKTMIMELMNVSSDALKTRKNRIKKKMPPYLFDFIFGAENQGDTKKYQVL